MTNYRSSHFYQTLRIASALTLFASSSAYSDSKSQPPSSIQDQGHAFLSTHLTDLYPNANLSIDVQSPSKGLKLANCRQPLSFTAPKRINSRVSLLVSCSAPGWRIYLSVRLKVLLPVITARKKLSKGKPINAESLNPTVMDILPLRGRYFDNYDDIVGLSPKKDIAHASVITPQSLELSVLIRKGDAVIIEAKRQSLSIRSTGTALENGKKGEQISIRNDKSGKTIRAFVESKGLARTPG